jgi:hypothetical protein
MKQTRRSRETETPVLCLFTLGCRVNRKLRAISGRMLKSTKWAFPHNQFQIQRECGVSCEQSNLPKVKKSKDRGYSDTE